MSGADPNARINLSKANVLLVDGSQHSLDMLVQIMKGFGAAEVRDYLARLSREGVAPMARLGAEPIAPDAMFAAMRRASVPLPEAAGPSIAMIMPRHPPSARSAIDVSAGLRACL